MMDAEMRGLRMRPEKKTIVWLGIAVIGAVLAIFSVYLCYFSYKGQYPETSLPAIAAGLGLILGFCVLTVSFIAGIRIFIIRIGREIWPISVIVLSGVLLTGLIGLFIRAIVP